MDFEFFGTCQGCKQRKFYISKRYVTIPTIKIKAKSQIKICGECFDKIKNNLDNN